MWTSASIDSSRRSSLYDGRVATGKNERLLNLVICLMSARQYVTADYLRKNVIGYKDAPDKTDDTFKRMLERDKNELREMGIPVETGRNPLSAEDGYRIKPADYALPAVSLEADEAAAVAAAAAVWRDPDVSVVSQTAVLKLRAAGVEVASPDELAVMSGGATKSMGSEATIRGLLSAIEARQSVTFTHRTAKGRAERRLEPWGVVGNRGRWYVVGHDLDRDATRTFRLSRVENVATASDRGSVHVPTDVDLNALVESAVSGANGASGVTASIWLAADRGHALRRLATTTTPHSLSGDEGDVVQIELRSPSAVIRAVLDAGADAVVLEPADLRAEVIAELDRLVDMEVTR
ncbi:proteasome accessory factor B [Gordonia malaquae]|nr:proteasome accessory factor B [Gordonia malaquae]